MQLATAQQMREMDRRAIEERKIPSLTLMEHAAQALADAVIEFVEAGAVQAARRKAVFFCGPGNNGGDGVAAARLLLEAGWDCRTVLVGKRDRMTADCRTMEEKLLAVGGKLEPFTTTEPEFASWCLSADVMVDALFGVGLNTEVHGDAAIAVQMMNTCAVPVVSADIASGVDADTGRIMGCAVRADRTVTFTYAKPGHFVSKGGLCCGRLSVAQIGIPDDLMRLADSPVRAVTRDTLRLPVRPRDAHKGNFGKVYIIGGSMCMSGAPAMAAQAAVRSGAGVVTVAVPYQVWPIVASKVDEAMVQPLPAGKEGTLELGAVVGVLEKLNRCDVCLIGPGLSRSNAVASVVRNILHETKIPVVLDADGINALEGHIDVLDERTGRCTILTPHDMEFQRLGGDLSHGDRLRAAREFALTHGCCVVLKGHRTITAFPDGAAYVNTTGNPGMAKGGSGDVLAGIIVSLLGQDLTPREAVPMAVYLHGQAGDLCAETLGEYGMTPMDIIAALPRVVSQIVK